MATDGCQRRSFRSRRSVKSLALAIGVAVAALWFAPVHAQVGSARYSSIVVEAASGQVLQSAAPDAPRHPASLTKLMTLYMAFEALRDRRIALDQHVPVSAHAASMAPTKLGLVPGTRITVDQAIMGLVTKSANDAAAALGEMLGGSEDRFAQMMTLRARALGMTHTTFMNASGLPDPDQWTTARDMAVLARRLISGFPNEYRYFSVPSFTWQRRVIANHDHLLRSYPGADGMKTGYTQASGYNLVSSATRGGVRLVGVVLGAASGGERDAHMMALLDQGYGQLDVPLEHAIARASSHGLIGSAQAAPVERAAGRRHAAAGKNAHHFADAGKKHGEPVALKRQAAVQAHGAKPVQPASRVACAGTGAAKHKIPCAGLRSGVRQAASRS